MVQSPTTPCQFDMWKNEDVPRSDVPFPQSNLVVHSPTTPGQFHMWNNADVPRSDVPPTPLHLVVQSPTTPGQLNMWNNADIPRSMYPPIKPSGTEHYYTRSVWHVEEYRCIQVRCTPPLIEPSGTEHYYTRSGWHVEECRHTQVKCSSSHILAPNVCKCYKDYFHSTSIHSYPSTYDYIKVLLSRNYFHFLLNLQFFGSDWHSVRHFLTGKKVFEQACKSAHICFWVCQTQCTMLSKVSLRQNK